MADTNDTVPQQSITMAAMTYGSVFVGTIGIPLNIFVLIMLHRKKDAPLLLKGMVVADVLYATSFFTFGIRSMILAHMPSFRIQSFKCFVIGIHLTLAELGESSISLMAMMLSLDRFICMHDPIAYRGLGSKMSRPLITGVYTYCLIDWIWSSISSYLLPMDQTTDSYCWHSQSVGYTYYMWHNWQITLSGYVSIALYLAAIATVHLKSRKIESNDVNDSIRKSQLKRDIMITKRMALVTVATFVLQSLPMTINLTFSSSVLFAILNPYLFLMFGFTVAVNVFVYVLLIPDYRQTFWEMLPSFKGKLFYCCKNTVAPTV